MPKFSTQPFENGRYAVIRWNELLQRWAPIEWYSTEEQAEKRAAELNDEYKKDLQDDK